MPLQILRIQTMHHQRDRRIILDLLKDMPGVTHASANLAERLIQIEHTEALSLAAILHALRAAGYEASVLV
nr:heavy metal-associated domain-containing protein [Oscillochloris trichoides]